VDVGKELVRRHFDEIWNDRNLSACEDLMADAFLEHAPAPFSTESPGAVNGPAAMRSTCTWLLAQFPDLTMTIQSVIAEGDLVAALVWAEGTNTGKLNGFLPPSGRRFKYLQTHWFRVRDDRLCEHWATRDDLSAMLQLGVVTPPRLGALVRQVRANVGYRLRRT
jgi:predicted ester cyclase